MLDRISERRRTVPSDVPASALGTVVLDWFRLERVIGTGTYSLAFQGKDTRDGRPCVVKIARPHLLEGPHAPQIRRRFADELRAITRIQHPNLVRVFQAGQTPEGLPAIAMEYIQGTTLGEHLRGRIGAMPTSEVALCFEQLGSALEAIHGAGIVHRDVSPDNVMYSLAADGSPKITLLDFGVAKLAGESAGTVGAVGTPGFMAPEQLMGSAVAASDIYALGAILWWALSGRAYDGVGGHGSADRGGRPLTDDVAVLNPNAPRPMLRILERLLATDPRRRPSAGEFLRQWTHVCASHRCAPATEEQHAPLAPPPQWGGAAPQAVTREEFPRHRDLRVLLVDPNPISQRLIHGYLRKLRCAVEVTDDPRRATRSTEGEFDALLLSAHLEGVAVADIVEHLGEHYPDRPTLLLGYRRGAVDHASMPIHAFVEIPGSLGALERHLDEIAGARPHRAPREDARTGGSLDETAMSSLVGDDPELALQTIDMFVGEIPEELAALEECEDADEARRIAQTIAISSQIVGADHLARLASALPELVDIEGIGVIEGFHHEMEREYSAVFRQLMKVRRTLLGD